MAKTRLAAAKEMIAAENKRLNEIKKAAIIQFLLYTKFLKKGKVFVLELFLRVELFQSLNN